MNMQNVKTLFVNNLYNEFNNKYINCNISLCLPCCACIFIRGCNGVGKTILLGCIIQDVSFIRGVILSIYNSIYYVGCLPCRESTSASVIDIVKLRCSLFFSSTSCIKMYTYAFNIYTSLFKSNELLSSGQERLVTIINILISNRIVWALDEPFNALDVVNKRILLFFIKKHIHLLGTSIVITHANTTIHSKTNETLWII